jgi:hypothetical protein
MPGRPPAFPAAAAGAAAGSAAGRLSFKSSYGSLMDATGLTGFLADADAGAQGLPGASPMLAAFAMPPSLGGQAASFPRSLGPVGDIMDVGSPAAWDGAG